jgi:hypothetical protein
LEATSTLTLWVGTAVDAAAGAAAALLAVAGTAAAVIATTATAALASQHEADRLLFIHCSLSPCRCADARRDRCEPPNGSPGSGHAELSSTIRILR